MAGVLFCQSYFDGTHRTKPRSARSPTSSTGASTGRGRAAHAGHPPWAGRRKTVPDYDWRGYNEAMLVYILALGSPTLPVGARPGRHGRGLRPKLGNARRAKHLTFGAAVRSSVQRTSGSTSAASRTSSCARRGIDYFENSRRAAYAQRAYAIRNPLDWRGYGATSGASPPPTGPAISTVDDAASARIPRLLGARHWHRDGRLRRRHARAHCGDRLAAVRARARDPRRRDMHKRFGQYIYGKYGFVDAFNPSFDLRRPAQHGPPRARRRLGRHDYLGIDQGAIISMIENHRSELMWTVMRRNPPRAARPGTRRLHRRWLTATVQ